ncbi:MAG: DUF362 domain-containing protein, partial [Akkermansia sp.]
MNTIQHIAMALAGAALLGIGVCTAGEAAAAELPKVYFTTDISPQGLLKLYERVNGNISGRVAIKWHSGERGGPNILPVPMVKGLQQAVPDSTLVETNTLYRGDRYTTEEHRKTLEVNGWTFCKVDIMDEHGTTWLPVRNGKHFRAVSMGKGILDYDSMVVLTHFKGHAMGGFGGSIKNIAIGCADGRVGKSMVHGVSVDNQPTDWNAWPSKEALMENMVESAKATVDHFGGKMCFINVLRRMSVDCDCAGKRAAEPKAADIGILASTDIVAVDQASIDMVQALPEEQKHDLNERIETRRGMHQL